jgi:predicted ATPase/DNA-binding SARP family transcriptional activator
MPRLSLRLLGPPLVELDGQPVQLGRHKAVALLAYLALTRQPHSRDALATLLWPELDQSGARGQLRRTLSLLNRTLGREWLAVDRETAGWAADAEAWVDVDHLRERLAACAGHGHPPEQACEDCVPLLAEAVDLYRDGFLAGFTLPDAPAFDEWQFFEGEGLRDGVADALQQLARWNGGHGEYDAAIPYARRWLALDPLHEPAQRELMALYARSGQRAAALRQYGECERVLGEELGLSPAVETTALCEAIRAGRELAPETPAAGFDSPRLVSPRRHNLPVQLTPFVGRGKELAELSELLAPSAEARLVTVVGPGGMGKTRLALEAASRQLDHYPDGVWFVSLAPVQSVEAIVPAMAQALGVPFFRGEPPRRQLVRSLQDKRMLLVLDNLEHLLESSDLLVELLRTAPGVRLLITSRVRLNVMGEFVFMLAGMDYPEPSAEGSVPGELRRYSSVALFLRSARRIRSTVELSEKDLPHVARICRLAQGMPLAILLAAAWVPALPPAEIAAEMERSLDFLAVDWRDAPERHHSIRAVFDATWGMLTEGEREAFARLSVFRGGFTREPAQAVAGTDLRTLISLVSKSLLQRDRSGRYEVHELLRQYAEGRLGEDPAEREKTLELHCAYYAEFLRCRETDLWRGYLQEALREMDNIRAAWRWATMHRKTAQVCRCLLSVYHLYQGPGLLQERETVFGEAVVALQAGGLEELNEEREAALGLALVLQSHFSRYLGYADKGDELVQEGLAILRRLGIRREVAHGYAIASYQPPIDPIEARQLLEESLAISRELECYPAMSEALRLLSFVTLRQGAHREAEEYGREALSVSSESGSRTAVAFALALLGHIARERSEKARAKRCYEESLALFTEVGHFYAVGRLHQHLGDVALAVGDYEEARIRHEQALACYKDAGAYWVVEHVVIGGCWGVPVSLQRLGDVALEAGDTADARQQYGQSLEMAIDHPHPELYLQVLLGPARLLAQEGHVKKAVEVAALARHHPVSVEETRDRAQELLDELQAGLLPDAYTAAEARGRARNLETTMRELLVEFEDI